MSATRRRTIRLVSFVVFVGLWQLAASLINNPVLLPSFFRTVGALVVMLGTARFWDALQESLVVLLSGLGLAVVVGIVVGLLMGTSRVVEYSLDQYVNVLLAMPRIALIPVIIVWLGIGPSARVALVFVLAVFDILVNTFYGVKNVAPEHQELAKSYNAKRRHQFFDISLPSAFPFMLSGFRLGIGRAITGVVTAELLLAFAGLGGLLNERGNQLRMADVYALALVFAALGITLTTAGRSLEKVGARWRPRET